MQPGDELKEDHELDKAKHEGIIVETRQGKLRISRKGKITAYSTYAVSVDGKQYLRSANQFIVVEPDKA